MTVDDIGDDNRAGGCPQQGYDDRIGERWGSRGRRQTRETIREQGGDNRAREATTE